VALDEAQEKDTSTVGVRQDFLTRGPRQDIRLDPQSQKLHRLYRRPVSNAQVPSKGRRISESISLRDVKLDAERSTLQLGV
jgi:hypothetical protein